MTGRGMMLVRGLRMNLDLAKEHDKSHPDETAEIIAALVSHVRAWKPEALLRTLDTGPVVKLEPPTE